MLGKNDDRRCVKRRRPVTSSKDHTHHGASVLRPRGRLRSLDDRPDAQCKTCPSLPRLLVRVAGQKPMLVKTAVHSCVSGVGVWVGGWVWE